MVDYTWKFDVACKTSDLLKLNDQDLISEYEKLISGDLGSYRTFYRERYILNFRCKINS